MRKTMKRAVCLSCRLFSLRLYHIISHRYFVMRWQFNLSRARSRQLEVMGAKKNGASEGNTRGEKELPLPSRVSLSRRVLFCAVTFKRLLRRLSLILIFCLQNLLFIYLFGKKITHYIKLFLFCFRRKSKRKLLGVRTTTR